MSKRLQKRRKNNNSVYSREINQDKGKLIISNNIDSNIQDISEKDSNMKVKVQDEIMNELLDKINQIDEYTAKQTISFNSLVEQNKNNVQEIGKLNNKINEQEKKISQLSIELEKKKQELVIAQQNVKINKEKIENSLSFQLGYKLIHATKSWKNFLSLPGDLIALRLQAKNIKEVQLHKNIQNNIKKAKITNWEYIDGKLKKQYNYKFISILDEISHISFDSEFKLFPLNKNNFENQIIGSTSIGLLLESCWKGNFGSWEYAFTSPNLQHQNAQNLLKALSVARDRKFPIIFWNKEDPMHYEKFLPIASKCDIIFTTDSNKVEEYQRDVPHAKVETMMFAANIYLCNPANRFRYPAENICFAGSYYGEGHDNRKKQMDALLPTIIKFNGVIYDRMSLIGNPRYSYPQKYHKFIRSSVPFKEIIDIYKQFKVFLNVNTITDSPTMMSRRVYELLACGTPVISTPSIAIDEQFKGIVQIARNAKEANKIAKRLLENEWEWLRLSHLGYREVMLKHTYEHRAIQIANALGQEVSQNVPLVSIVMASNRPHFIDRIVKNISEQVHSNLEVIIIAQKYNDIELQNLEQKLNNSGKTFSAIHIIRNDSEDTLGKRLNQAIALSKGDYVAKFDDDDFYFPNYLQDMLIPFKFGDYGIVGKKEIFIYLENQDKTFVRYYGQRHLQTDFLTGATLIFSRAALKKLSFGDLNKGEDSNIIEQAKQSGIKMYVADPFNFIVFRSKNTDGHTWQVTDDFFTTKGKFVGNGLANEITVI